MKYAEKGLGAVEAQSRARDTIDQATKATHLLFRCLARQGTCQRWSRQSWPRWRYRCIAVPQRNKGSPSHGRLGIFTDGHAVVHGKGETTSVLHNGVFHGRRIHNIATRDWGNRGNLELLLVLFSRRR